MKTPLRVAIVGRPNVGKSTLFNRLTRQRRALVHPMPGVTRDIQRCDTAWTGHGFELIDTGGLFSGVDDELMHEVERRALNEALGADLMLFVTDAETGVTPTDVEVADRLRRLEVPALLVVNKAEKHVHLHAQGEFYKLGFEQLHAVSALHGQGIGDLLDAVVAMLPRREPHSDETELKLALVGRPNGGKSSLVNAMVGSDVSIVDSRPGTTRDSIDLSVQWYGHRVTLVDTAGIRRRSRSKDGLTSLTAIKSIDSISRADVVVVVLDATRDIANQDVKVTSYAHKAGKGILFCVNKWDLIDDKTNASVPEFEKRIRHAFSFVTYAPILFTSALTGQRVSRIYETAWRIKENRELRLSTSEVNRFIEESVAVHAPPSFGGGSGRIYYATQVEVGPPTICIFVNRRAFFARTYLRYLNNRLRNAYGFEGTVIRLKLKEKDKREEL